MANFILFEYSKKLSKYKAELSILIKNAIIYSLFIDKYGRKTCNSPLLRHFVQGTLEIKVIWCYNVIIVSYTNISQKGVYTS